MNEKYLEAVKTIKTAIFDSHGYQIEKVNSCVHFSGMDADRGRR